MTLLDDVNLELEVCPANAVAFLRRIKRALEAAKEMDRFIQAVSVKSLTYRDIDRGLVLRKQLRAAMEGYDE